MAAEEDNTLDNIFRSMGELKLFTFYQALLLALVNIPAAYHLLNNVFTCRDVKHRCASVPNDSSLLLSGLDGYDSNDLSISYQQCQIVVSYNETVLKTEECIYGMAYEESKDASVVSQFDLVCDYSSLAKLSQTLLIAGQGIGAVIFTMLADRMGRKPVLVLCNLGLLVFGLITAYAPNYLVFAFCKFLAGALQQGCITSFASLGLEALTTRKRRFQAPYSGTAWGLSSMSLALWAYVFRHHSWRTTQMALSLSSLPFILHYLYLRESLRWLIANGKSKQIVSYIRCATKLNKTSLQETLKAYESTCRRFQPESDGEEDHDIMTETENVKVATKKLTLLDILKDKRLFICAVTMWLAWFTTALCFFAIYMNSTTLAGDPYLNYFLTAIMELPHNFFLFAFLKRFGRKPTMIILFVVVCAGITISGIFQSMEQTEVNSALALLFSCLAMSGASGAFAFIFFYTTEMFPTNVRTQALGVSSMAGRVGGMIGPFTGVLGEKAKWAPGVMIGGCAFIICLLSIFLPETRGRELPQTIEDVKAWFSDAKTRDIKGLGDEDEESDDDL